MPESLRTRIHDLASAFAESLLRAIRGASLQELLGERPGRPPREAAGGEPSAPRASSRRGRLPRRSAADIARVVEKIVSLLKQNPKGLRAEQIRDKLGLQSKELPRPLQEALDGGRIAKSGQKRSTTYFIKGRTGGGGSSAGARRGRRAVPARKSRRKAARGAVRAGPKAASGARRAKASEGQGQAPEKKAPVAPALAAPAQGS